VIEFVSGALCFKAMRLSAMEKPYVGGNRKSIWVPGVIMNVHLTSITRSRLEEPIQAFNSFTNLSLFYLTIYALATEANMSVKLDSRNGYTHGHVMVSSWSAHSQLTVTENILCVYFNASVHTSRRSHVTGPSRERVFARIPYLTQN
jgi:hypothetical protein